MGLAGEMSWKFLPKEEMHLGENKTFEGIQFSQGKENPL